MTTGMAALKVVVTLAGSLLISVAGKYPPKEERVFFCIGYGLIVVATFAV